MKIFDLPLWLLAVPMVWGINFIFWGAVGFIRVVQERFFLPRMMVSRTREKNLAAPVAIGEVAAIVPAHNERLIIRQTIESLARLLPRRNIFVVSDGSSDETVTVARTCGVNVVELSHSRGKAGALESAIKHFDIIRNFAAVLFVDADTILKEDYLANALPFFRDRRVAAVAGYARTMWYPKKLSWEQKFVILHRDRVYFLSQMLLKFGQTWRHTNVANIVPGFASIYRTRALAKMNLNPVGLVIEDFNMTFEIHRKQLGLIAHGPRVVGYTQDPDNLRDYWRQIRRWNLGLWQTIRLHGFWPSKFWIALCLLLAEVSLSSALVLLMAVALVLWLLINALLLWHGISAPVWLLELATIFSGRRLPNLFIFGIFLPDYLLSVAAGIVMRRPQYFLLGLGFWLLRVVDSLAFLSAIPRAFVVKSTGRWTSPTRR